LAPFLRVQRAALFSTLFFFHQPAWIRLHRLRRQAGATALYQPVRQLTVAMPWHVTPLMYATRAGHQSIAEALIKAGAKNNMQAGCRGKTALMLALENGHLPIIKLLLDHGAGSKNNKRIAAQHLQPTQPTASRPPSS